MAKRIILVSSFPVCAALVIIGLIIAGVGRGQPAVSTAVPQAIAPAPFASERTNILSLADAGKLAEADAAINKLTSDCKDAAILTANYDIIADSFAWRRMYDRAGRLYQLIIDKSPDSSLVNKSRLGLARIKILGLIDAQNFSEAKVKLDSIIKDFNSVPELENALFQLGLEFKWRHRFIEAATAFDNISSSSDLANKAKLLAAMSDICAMITNGPVDASNDMEITAAIDKLVADFAGDAGLAEAVYWISKEYEWKKGRVEIEERKDWYNTPNSVYGKLMRQFGDTTYGWEAEWDQKKLSHRMKIFNLMKEPNQAATDAAIEAMAADLKGRPELSGELRWIAWGYEEQNNGSQAKQIFKRIIRECPGTVDANEAVLDIRRLDIDSMIDSGDTNSADALMDKFIADFGQHPYSVNCFKEFAMKYYKAAMAFKDKNQPEKAKQYGEILANIWQKLPKDTLQRGTETTYLYFYVAINYQELGRWDDAIQNYQKVLDERPDFEYACSINAAIAVCYESLRDKAGAPKEGINPLIEEAYKAVLADAAGCYMTKEAAYKLAGMMLEKGDKAAAAKYYKKFLETANPKDGRLASVKAKVAELTAEGGNN